MEYGSERVWVYDYSDDEYVSEGELEEGMWLSDSSDDEAEDTVTSTPKLPPAGAAGPPADDLEGSKTKYLPPEEDSDDSDEPQAAGGKEAGKTYAYADLDLVKGGDGVRSKEEEPGGDYVTLKPQPPAPAPSPPAFKVPPSAARSAPPPPPVHKGIMKNRLNSQRLKRVKKARKTPTPSVGFMDRPSRGRVVRRSDTNILAVKFNKLIEPSNVHTGDAVLCGNEKCLAVLSHLSSVTDQEGKSEKLWVCEFCGEHNEVDVEKEEVPTKPDTTFLVAPAPAVEGVAGAGVAGMGEALVVFCIDISGSMCVTTEVPGKFELKGHDRVKGLSSLNTHNEDQYLPRQRRDVTYVSRLQSYCSPEAIKAYDHLSHMIGSAIVHEEKRCGYLHDQVAELMQLLEDADIPDPSSDVIVQESSLANSLHSILCSLQNGKKHIQVRLNSWTEVNILLATGSSHSSSTAKIAVPPSHQLCVRSYSAMLLFEGAESLLKSLPPTASPAMHRLVQAISPMKSTPISVCWFQIKIQAKDIDPTDSTYASSAKDVPPLPPEDHNIKENRSALPMEDCIVLYENSMVFRENRTYNVVGTFRYVAHFHNGASQVKKNFTFHVYSSKGGEGRGGEGRGACIHSPAPP